MNRKFASLFVAAGLMFSAQCFGHEKASNPNRQMYEIVSADRVFITEKGIFFEDIEGIVRQASNLAQTSQGLVATLSESSIICTGCCKKPSKVGVNFVCWTIGCPYFGSIVATCP